MEKSFQNHDRNNGFSKVAPEDINFEDEDNLLPHEVYHYTVIVHTNDNCSNAKIKIKAVGIIPDSDCLKPHKDNPTTTTKGYIKLSTENNNTCIFTGNNTVTLADKSIFSLSNSIIGPCQNHLLNFKTHKNTLLLHPKHDRAYMTIGCEGNKDLKQVIYKDEMVVPPSKCSVWVTDTKKKKLDMERDFIEVEEEFINSEDGSKIEGNVNMTRNSIIFLPFKALIDLEKRDEENEEYVAFINSIFNEAREEREENQQGSKLFNITIVVTCTLVLVLLCCTLWKIKQRTPTVAHLTIWHTQGGDQQNGQATLEEKEETRELLERKHSEKEQREPYSHRRRPCNDTYLKESQTKVEDRYNDEKNRSKGTEESLKDSHHKVDDKNFEERNSSKEMAENLEEHYDVPRILYGREHNMHVYEYLDDTVFFMSESEKNASNETIMETVTLENKTSEKDENSKNTRNINKMGAAFEAQNSKENRNQLETKGAQHEETLDNEPTTPVQEQASNNKRSEDPTQSHKDEEQKTEPLDLERENQEKMENEEIYETMVAESSSQAEKNRNDIEKNQYEDISHGSLHDRMLKELHSRFLAMQHLHNLQ